MVSLFFVHLERHGMRHLIVVWEVDAITTVGFSAKGGFFLAAQHLDFPCLEIHALAIEPIGFRYRAFLFVQEVDAVYLVAFLRETELAIGERIDGTRAIDGFAVDAHPLADLLQAEQGGVGQVAVGVGTDVE